MTDLFPADALQEALLQYLGAWGKLRETSTDAFPLTTEEWVSNHGRTMTKRHVLKSGVTPFSKACYQNAWRIFKRHPGLRYCEGYVQLASCPIPVMHGWCINQYGEIVDPSVEQDQPAVYYGVVYEETFARGRWAELNRKKLIGILPNRYIFRHIPEQQFDEAVSQTKHRSQA